MLIGRPEGATRVVGRSQGYLGLPILDKEIVDPVSGELFNVMTTSWIPTGKEIEAIVAGAPIHVHIFGSTHPPIYLDVGDVPK